MAAANPFRNRVALVTGASGGIGQAIARRLATEGAAVALAYGATADPARQLAGELVASGGHALAVDADLRRAEAPAELLAEVADLALAILRNPYMANQVVSVDGGMHPR